MKLIHFPRQLFERDQFGVFDDFLYYADTDFWTKLDSDTGATVAIDADGVGGVVALTTGATDNNEALLASTNEVFKFAAGKPWIIEARIQYAEANTDDANLAFGLGDALGANLLGDDAGGVSASFTTAAFIYKVDGGTVWKAYSENGSDSEDSTSQTTAGGSSYQTLRIEGRAIEGDVAAYEITFFVDGEPLRDSNEKAIKHEISYASATEMDLGVYVKAGGANSEVVNVDYVCAYQQR